MGARNGSVTWTALEPGIGIGTRLDSETVSCFRLVYPTLTLHMLYVHTYVMDEQNVVRGHKMIAHPGDVHGHMYVADRSSKMEPWKVCQSERWQVQVEQLWI